LPLLLKGTGEKRLAEEKRKEKIIDHLLDASGKGKEKPPVVVSIGEKGRTEGGRDW